MKVTKFLKVTAVAVFTTGFTVGCASSGGTQSTQSVETATEVAEKECVGASPEAKNAMYAAKLRIARARNLDLDWRDAEATLDEAEIAAELCENVRAKILADKAEQQAADLLAAAEKEAMAAELLAAAEKEAMAAESDSASDSQSTGGYLVVDGDNLWDIAAKNSIYGNPYQWPLIYKANSIEIQDADLIFAGQYFNIPKATDAESDAAIEHAKTRGAWSIGETEASDTYYLNQ